MITRFHWLIIVAFALSLLLFTSAMAAPQQRRSKRRQSGKSISTKPTAREDGPRSTNTTSVAKEPTSSTDTQEKKPPEQEDSNATLEETLQWLQEKIKEYCHKRFNYVYTSYRWKLLGWEGTVITLQEIEVNDEYSRKRRPYDDKTHIKTTTGIYIIDLSDVRYVRFNRGSFYSVDDAPYISISANDGAYKFKSTVTVEYEGIRNGEEYRRTADDESKSDYWKEVWIKCDGNDAMAERMVKAFTHAVKLCQKPKKKEPF